MGGRVDGGKEERGPQKWDGTEDPSRFSYGLGERESDDTFAILVGVLDNIEAAQSWGESCHGVFNAAHRVG